MSFVIADRGDAILVNVLCEYTVPLTVSVVVVTVHTTAFNLKQHDISYLLLIDGVLLDLLQAAVVSVNIMNRLTFVRCGVFIWRR